MKRDPTYTSFDLGSFITALKADPELQISSVKLNFQDEKTQSSAARQGDGCAINLATAKVIQERMRLNAPAAAAKQKAALIEEMVHCSSNDAMHNDTVVSKTTRLLQKYLSPEELAMPYIREKIRRLENQPERYSSETRPMTPMLRK